MRSIHYIGFILISLIMGLIPATFAADVLDGIAANADGELITISDLKQRLTEMNLDNSKAKEVLDKMIDESIMDSEIRKRGLTTTPAEIDEAVQQVIRQNGLTTSQELAKLLKDQGLTEAEFRSNLKHQIEQGKFVNYVMGTKIKITEEDVQTYYEANYVRDQGENDYRLRSIFIAMPDDNPEKLNKAKARLQKLQAELKKGVDFVRLVKKYSDGPAVADGGLMGDFKPEELDEAFLQAIAKLKPGEVSAVVQKKEGAYIFKLENRVKGSPPPLKNVEAEIMRKLQTQEIERLYRIWMRQARERAYIEIRIKDFSQI